jgi:hypothetical protein
MKSPKMILLGGVAALTATVVIAQLTPEQRRAADEALRQKMEELNARERASKGSKAAKPAPAPAPAPVVKSTPAPAPVVASAPAAKGLTPEQEAAARQALRNAMAAQPAAPSAVVAGAPSKGLTPEQEAAARQALRNAMAAQPAAPSAVVAGAPSKGLTPEQEAAARQALRNASLPPSQPVNPPTVVKTTASNPSVIVATKGLTPEQEAAAREALMLKMAELNARDAKPAAPAAPKLVVAQPAQQPAAAPVKTQPVAPRAVKGKPMPEGLPISQAQWDQIVALTALYKADRITPTEYHAKRASIIAEGTGSTGGEQ